MKLVRALVALAVLVEGCRSLRPACEALPRLEIAKQEATFAEYMPGYDVENLDEALDGDAFFVAHESLAAIVKTVQASKLQTLRECGEAPLVRLTGKGDGARCMMTPSLTRYSVVGRILHTPTATRQYVKRMDWCEAEPIRFVARRYERATDERSWAKVDQCLRESGFDGMPLDAQLNLGVFDGTSYFLEAVRNGRYHAVLIHEPDPRAGGAPTVIDCCQMLLSNAKTAEAHEERWPPPDKNIIW